MEARQMPNPDSQGTASILGRALSVAALLAVLAFAPAVAPMVTLPAYAVPAAQDNNQNNNNEVDNNQNNNNEVDNNQNNNNEDDNNQNNNNEDDEDTDDNVSPVNQIDAPSSRPGQRGGTSDSEESQAPPVPTEEPLYTGPVLIEVAEPSVKIYPLGTALVETVLWNPIAERQLFALQILLVRGDGTVVAAYLSDPVILKGNTEAPAAYTVRHAEGAVRAVITPVSWPNLD
jgi:hypothetical protein